VERSAHSVRDLDHPRLRGEHAKRRNNGEVFAGSPPPARGAHIGRVGIRVGDRITPACAGSTPSPRSRGSTEPDHPRLRGEHTRTGTGTRSCTGSPPPARGAHLGEGDGKGDGRITPACAGSTPLTVYRSRGAPDHPRLRGEHQLGVVGHGVGSGSPPPARGAPAAPEGGALPVRITPACAGSTRRRLRTVPARTDHPRLRGEHQRAGRAIGKPRGSPPPARGALRRRAGGLVDSRITPACAGSTGGKYVNPWPGSDHPRLRGEHIPSSPLLRCIAGSPPPARGAQLTRHLHQEAVRITPACAGSTSSVSSVMVRVPDHPRLRGEHTHGETSTRMRGGSPPPARGAHRVVDTEALVGRITPACAGST